MKLGTLGVYIFFGLSGFLVMQSWHLHPRAGAFIGKRMLRIMPGLIGATLFAVFVVGPALSSVPIMQYLKNPASMAYLGNVALYNLSYSLPGTFTANPYPAAVNGPLWTLPYEFTMYLMLALIGALAVIKPRLKYYLLLIIPVIIIGWAIFQDRPHAVLDMNLGWFFTYAGFFASGAALFHFRKRIILSDVFALLALTVAILSRDLAIHTIIQMILIPYLVLYLGTMEVPRLARFGKYGDFSYGMYIYAWPVQQIFTSGNPIGPLRLMALAFPVTIVLAALSWHFIEQPALSHKKYFNKTRYPIKLRAAAENQSPMVLATTEEVRQSNYKFGIL